MLEQKYKDYIKTISLAKAKNQMGIVVKNPMAIMNEYGAMADADVIAEADAYFEAQKEKEIAQARAMIAKGNEILTKYGV